MPKTNPSLSWPLLQCALQCMWTVRVNSNCTLLRTQALGRLRGSSNPNRDASSRTCGYLRGAASVAQGWATREEVLATALPACICSTTSTRDRSFASARLVVIPWSITAIILVYAVEIFVFATPYSDSGIKSQCCLVIDSDMCIWRYAYFQIDLWPSFVN